MDKISKLTKGVLIAKGLNKAAGAALICHEAEKVFRELFDKEFLKETKIISSRDGCIYLSTTSSVYSQEIILREKDIIDAINNSLADKVVKKIRFKPKKGSLQDNS